jgi:hypothetical protein
MLKAEDVPNLVGPPEKYVLQDRMVVLDLGGQLGLARAMMRKFFAVALLALGLTSGCTDIRDARGPSEYCEVHHTYMQGTVVPAPRDNTPLPPEYVEAGLRLFPHGIPEYHPSSRHKLVIYICDGCVRAQEEWKRLHPGVVK